MKEQKNETTIGKKCEIQIRPQGKYEYLFAKLGNKKGSKFNHNDVVHVLTPSEYSKILESYNSYESQQETITNLKQTLDEKDAEITSLKSTINELKQTLEQNNRNNESINKYKQELKNKHNLINDLTISMKDYKTKYGKLEKESDTIITQLKARIDELGIQLDNSPDVSELETLHQELETTKTKLDYWQKSYNKLNDENTGILDENDSLKKTNIATNQTNTLLNENIIALTSTFDKTKQEITTNAENKEKELKETIKKQQLHIDELTNKYESLLPLKEHIPQKQHYNELKELQDKINDAESELNKTKNEIETKLTKQKSDLDIEYTNEKAQLLVAYNNEINQLKTKYNELASEYNYLLNDASSLSRINTLLNGKHNDIVKNRKPVELQIITGQSSDEIIEYVPKE